MQKQALSVIDHDRNGTINSISHFVERGNNRFRISQLTDYQKYINGYIKFFFEYTQGWRFYYTDSSFINFNIIPGYIPAALAESAINDTTREVGNLPLNYFTGNPCVVSYWGREPMLVDIAEFMNDIEIFVPSIIAVGFQVDNCIYKGSTDETGTSILYGFGKRCTIFTKGKLDISLPFFVRNERRNNFPIGIVKGTPEIMNCISTNNDNSIYDGIVSFSKGGALSGLCICFKNIREGAFFMDYFGKIRDVFRSSIKL